MVIYASPPPENIPHTQQNLLNAYLGRATGTSRAPGLHHVGPQPPPVTPRGGGAPTSPYERGQALRRQVEERSSHNRTALGGGVFRSISFK